MSLSPPSSAGCRKREEKGGMGQKWAPGAGASDEAEKVAIIPVQSAQETPEGVGLTHRKGYHDCRGFIKMNKSLLYMAE